MAVHIDSVTRRASHCALSALSALAVLGVSQWWGCSAPTDSGTIPAHVEAVALTGSAPDGHADFAEAAAAAAATAGRPDSPSAIVNFLTRFSPLLGTASR